MKRIYLSGPMSSLPELNFPAFHAEAARLRALGFHPAAKEKTAKLYRASEFRRICAALVRHIQTVQE